MRAFTNHSPKQLSGLIFNKAKTFNPSSRRKNVKYPDHAVLACSRRRSLFQEKEAVLKLCLRLCVDDVCVHAEGGRETAPVGR